MNRNLYPPGTESRGIEHATVATHDTASLVWDGRDVNAARAFLAPLKVEAVDAGWTSGLQLRWWGPGGLHTAAPGEVLVRQEVEDRFTVRLPKGRAA